MSCGNCGTDAPHGENHEDKKCMACECPCDEHKEHNHDEHGDSHNNACEGCKHEHKGEGGKCMDCDCG